MKVLQDLEEQQGRITYLALSKYQSKYLSEYLSIMLPLTTTPHLANDFKSQYSDLSIALDLSYWTNIFTLVIVF